MKLQEILLLPITSENGACFIMRNANEEMDHSGKTTYPIRKYQWTLIYYVETTEI